MRIDLHVETQGLIGDIQYVHAKLCLTNLIKVFEEVKEDLRE